MEEDLSGKQDEKYSDYFKQEPEQSSGNQEQDQLQQWSAEQELNWSGKREKISQACSPSLTEFEEKLLGLNKEDLPHCLQVLQDLLRLRQRLTATLRASILRKDCLTGDARNSVRIKKLDDVAKKCLPELILIHLRICLLVDDKSLYQLLEDTMDTYDQFKISKELQLPSVDIKFSLGSNGEDVKYPTTVKRERGHEEELYLYESNGNNEETYCLCEQPSHGNMIACDHPDCPIEWYHYGCVNVKSAPKGSWYCPDCKKKNSIKRRRR